MKMNAMLTKLKEEEDAGNLGAVVLKSIVTGRKSEFLDVTKYLGLGYMDSKLVAKYETEEHKSKKSSGKYLSTADWKTAVFAELERATGARATDADPSAQGDVAEPAPVAQHALDDLVHHLVLVELGLVHHVA